MPDPWLSAAEVAELTGRVRYTAQSRKLAQMDVPFRLSGTGRPLVERGLIGLVGAGNSGQAPE